MLKRLSPYIKPYWLYYLIGFIALVATNYVTTLIPLEFKESIDLLSSSTTNKAVILSTVKQICILAVILGIVRSISRIAIFAAGRRIECDLRNDLFAHLLKLPQSVYQKESIGDLMSRMINDMQSIRAMTALGFLHISNTIMIFIFVLYQMLQIHLPLTLLIFLPIPIAMIMVKRFVGALYHHINDAQKALGSLSNSCVESLSNINTIKTFNAITPIFERFKAYNTAYQNSSLKVAKTRSQIFPFIGIIGSIGHVLVLFMGGQLIIKQQLSMGDFVAVLAYVELLAWPSASLAWIINIIQRGNSSLHRLNAVFNHRPYKTLAPPKKIEETLEITAKNLQFSYDKSPPTLKNISFTLKAGQSLGVFGPSGSGKTTLAKLICAIESAPENTLFYNNTPQEKWKTSDLQHHISAVMQKPFLFSDTIEKNIAFYPFLKEKNKEKTVAKWAAIDKEINTFPQKWDTLIGEKGIILSGGQKSRLALARALYKPHSLLILDDVLSAVDHDTEHQLIQTLKKQTQSSIIISHRLSALEHCDHILVLNNGEIIDEGKHSDLIKRDGIYQRTWHYQNLDSAA